MTMFDRLFGIRKPALAQSSADVNEQMGSDTLFFLPKLSRMPHFASRSVMNMASAFLALLVSGGCAPPLRDIVVTINPSAISQLQVLPAQIGITVHDAARTRSFRLQAGSVSEVADMVRAQKTATAMGTGPGGATHILDNTNDYYVRGPYIISPDSTLLAASVELKGVQVASSTGFVIAEISTKRIIAITRSKTQGISALAWSPDSKFLAILRHEQVRVGHSPMEILSNLSGHPVQYVVYSLDVVDTSGKLIAKSQLTDALTGTWTELIWS